jgi:hypothetical protein
MKLVWSWERRMGVVGGRTAAGEVGLMGVVLPEMSPFIDGDGTFILVVLCFGGDDLQPTECGETKGRTTVDSS